MSDRYFELDEAIGLDPDGNPEPIHEVGLAVNIPTVKDGEIVAVASRVTVNAIPGTRILKVDDPIVAGALAGSGQYREVDPPKKADLDRQRKDTTDAREAAGTREEK